MAGCRDPGSAEADAAGLATSVARALHSRVLVPSGHAEGSDPDRADAAGPCGISDHWTPWAASPSRHRRRRARGRAAHRARRRADAGVHARRDEGDGQGRAPRRAARRSARRSSSATPTTCTSGPGEDVIAELGGLHRFMGWDGPILTDSGGFQVFSLRDTLARGRRRRRHVPLGLRRRLDALHAGARRGDPAQARLRHRDVPRPCARPPGVPRASSRTPCAGRRCWAARQRAAARAPGQLALRDQPGRADDELRRRSIAELTELDFDGYALGGLAIGEDREEMLATTAWSAPLLPAEKPRYFMGIGDPEGILDVVERGIDMFDCVWPTRPGRTGTRSRGRAGST